MPILSRLQSWRRARMLARHPLDPELWQTVVTRTDVLRGLGSDELTRLHDLATLFVHGKTFYATHDLVIDDYVRIAIAAQACLLILNLDSAGRTEVYPGWRSIILYPGAFVARHDFRDEVGIVHQRILALEGEASPHGPVVLSWEDAKPDHAHGGDGRNVVLHEFAHKLDYLDGTANGHPPLHADMSTSTWAAVFAAAFAHLTRQLEHHQHPALDPYAATNPAEFFAVVTEAFFATPLRLQHLFPDVYDQLVLYYRQDPGARLRGTNAGRM
ncbi:MAG: zinc-dependent peptidase [Pseudomonadales bacterium]